MDGTEESYEEESAKIISKVLESDKEIEDVEFDDEHEYDKDFEEFEGYERSPKDDTEWGMEEESVTVADWEKEIREPHIPADVRMGFRRTIYELDSYASAGPSTSDLLKLRKANVINKPRPMRYSVSMGIPGIARLNLSPLTQKIVGCVVGENVTAEYPWTYVRKEVIEDNIHLHDESSDFLPVKEDIDTFPDSKILIGYVPSLADEDQFYICLTAEGRDAILKHIQDKRQEHENRVRNAVVRAVGRWQEFGSSAEIDEYVIKNNRPLLEIEAVCPADLLNATINLTDRNSEEQRDGYLELLPYRQSFQNIPRKLLDRNIQVTPYTCYGIAQTVPSVPNNSWFQYKYEYEPLDISTFREEQIESLKSVIDRYKDELYDQTLINGTWDIYGNDYAKLVRNEKDRLPPVQTGFKDYQSYHDSKLIINKVINDLCWHPFWTGVAFAAYSQYSKTHYLTAPKADDEVLKACEGDNYVLVWSFNDCLTPRLVLECPREVTAVTICPLDGNVVIGGCSNGQVAIWHIPGKIEQVETITVQTSAQMKYKAAMKNLTTWTLDTISSSVVKPAAMSSLQHSQKGRIIQITWVPCYDKIDKNGRISSLPEETSPDDLNRQFITASEDGTIAFWDLKWQPSGVEARQAHKRKPKVPRPEALTQSVSPFSVFDRIFKPEYMLIVQHPTETRRLVITTMNMYNLKFAKEQVEPFPLSNAITVRRYYKSVLKKPVYVMKSKILVGTVEGNFGCIEWDGYDFSTDLSVNNETCRWCWMKTVHDGPVTHAIRSKYYQNIVATVGGKIFGVWNDEFGEPLIWKRSTVGYTACAWGSFRPTVLILARMDGTVEIWDFIVKSHEPCLTQSVSGRIITGIYTHELYLDPQCIGFCDFNGILRTFLSPGMFLSYASTDIEWMEKFSKLQIDRVRAFKAWQETWNKDNQESAEQKEKSSEVDVGKKTAELEEAKQVGARETTARQEVRKRSLTASRTDQFIEMARERWKAMELKRMQRVILEKKGLRKDELEKQRAPILKMRQDLRKKKRKIRETLKQQDRIFEETIAFLFPEHNLDRQQTTLPMIAEHSATNARTQTAEQSRSAHLGLEKHEKEYIMDDDEDIIYNFMEVQSEALARLENRPLQDTVDWRKFVANHKLGAMYKGIESPSTITQKSSQMLKSVSQISEF